MNLSITIDKTFDIDSKQSPFQFLDDCFHFFISVQSFQLLLNHNHEQISMPIGYVNS